MEVIEVESSSDDEQTFYCPKRRLGSHDLYNFQLGENLNLQNCQYFGIEADTFNTFYNFVSIDFSYNSIHSLPPNIFSNCSALKSLKFNSNKISIVPFKVFASIPQLEELSLMGNMIMSIDAPYFHSSTLKVLNLSYNFLERVDRQAFEQLRELKDLDLSYNRIYSLNNLVFCMNHKLELLFLNNNRLEELNEFQFMHLPLLKSASLQSNKLERLDSKMFWFNKTLRSLNLTDNWLTLPRTFQFHRNASLAYLNLSLTTILDFQVFRGISCLEDVTLKINANETFHLDRSNFNDFLCDQINLKEFKLIAKYLELGLHDVFRLSANATRLHLESLNPLPKKTDRFLLYKQLVATPVLRSLVLAGLNNLKILDFHFSFLSNNFKIYLEHLNCSGSRFCFGYQIFHPKFQPLKHLNLSFCSLTLDVNFGFSNLVNLEILILEGTRFDRITSQMFFFNRKLKYLNLENCGIEIVQDSSFVMLSALKRLNLRANPIRNLSPKTFLGLSEISTDILLDPVHERLMKNLNSISREADVVIDLRD